MIHILDKTYLAYHDDLLFGNDCIQVADIPADEVIYDSEVGKLLSGNVSKRLAYAKTLDGLMNQFANDDILFERFVNYQSTSQSNQLFLYFDPKAFKEFLVRWLKTILPNAEADTVAAVYNIYKNNELYSSHHLSTTHRHRKDVSAYWADEDELNGLMQMKSFSLSFDYKQYCSIEFLISSHLGGSALTSRLSNKLSSIATDRVLSDMNSIKQEIEMRLYDLGTVWSELKDVDFFNFDIAHVLAIKPELSFIGSRPFTEYADIHELSSAYDIKQLCTIMKEYTGNTHSSHQDSICFNQFLDKGFVVASPLEVLEADLNYGDIAWSPPYLGPEIAEGKINGYLLSLISQLYKQDATNKLRELSLE
jgi:hypothetical protein